MEYHERFNQNWRPGGSPDGGEDKDDEEIRYLPVVWRVIREFPEARRALEAAFAELRAKSKKGGLVA